MVGAFIYTGESYIDYYNTFKDNYFSFTINDSNEQDSEATLREILKAANKNNIELFAEGHENIVINDSKTKKIMPKETYYVTSPEVKEMLEKKDYILAGTHRTLFLGDCLYEYADLYKLKDLKSIKEFCCIYSDERDLTQFQLDMNESNSAVEFIDISKATPEKIKVVCLWCLVAIVYLLLTAYELAFERKKAAIKMSFGEKHATLIIKNIMLDSAVILSEFAILILVLNIFTHTFFMWEAELAIVILMIALSIVVYLTYFKTDIHKAFSGYKSTKMLTGSINHSDSVLHALGDFPSFDQLEIVVDIQTQEIAKFLIELSDFSAANCRFYRNIFCFKEILCEIINLTISLFKEVLVERSCYESSNIFIRERTANHGQTRSAAGLVESFKILDRIDTHLIGLLNKAASFGYLCGAHDIVKHIFVCFLKVVELHHFILPPKIIMKGSTLLFNASIFHYYYI